MEGRDIERERTVGEGGVSEYQSKLYIKCPENLFLCVLIKKERLA